MLDIFDRSRRLIAAATACYLTGALLGVVLAVGTPVQRVPVPADTLGGLFAHNALVAVALAAGALTLGALTLPLLIFNGALLGYGITAGLDVLPWSRVLAGLAPHALLEAGGLILAGAAGFTTAAAVLTRLRAFDPPASASPGSGQTYTVRTAVGLLGAALVLLALAAPIEFTISRAAIG